MRHRLARRLRAVQRPVRQAIDTRSVPAAVRILLRSSSDELRTIAPLLIPRLDEDEQLKAVKLLCQKKISDARTFSEMLAFPTPKVLSTIVSAWMRTGNSKACLDSGLNLIERGVQPSRNALTTLIRAAGICNRLDILNRLWETKSVLGIKADSRMHGAYISACGRFGLDQLQSSYEVFLSSGAPHDHYTYCALIYALSHLSARADQEERRLIANHSERLFSEMLSGGVPPTTASVNVLINTLCKCEEVERARRLLKQNHPRITPDLFTYTPLLHRLALNGQFQSCRRIMCEMISQDIYPNGIALSSLMHGCNKNNKKPVLVWEAYQLVVQRHHNHVWDNLACSVIIQSLQHSESYLRGSIGLELIQKHYQSNHRSPALSMLLPLIVGRSPKEFSFERFLVAFVVYGPNRMLIDHAFRVAIKLNRIKLCMQLFELCLRHQVLLNPKTTNLLMAFFAKNQVVLSSNPMSKI